MPIRNITKNELRADMKQVIGHLDERWIKAGSLLICEELSKLVDSLKNAKRILAWIRFFPGESDLSQFISEQIESKEVFLPVSHEDGNMEYYQVNRWWQDELKQGFYGVPEPLFDRSLVYRPGISSKDTVVILPGLAFDKAGGRIGRGKGYYDKFFSSLAMKDSTKIGTCWNLQVVDKVPTEPHDIFMNWVVHERGVIKAEK